MPRRHRPIKHIPLLILQNEKSKTRYANKNAAERAAEIIMLQNMGLELSVYQGTDGGWYLTRQVDKEQV